MPGTLSATTVLKSFVDTVNATGGVQRDAKGLHAPVADPDWVDLGEVYIEACRVLNVKKHVVDARTGIPVETP